MQSWNSKGVFGILVFKNNTKTVFFKIWVIN